MEANGCELYRTIIWSNERERDTFAQLKSVCRAWMTPWDIGNDSNDAVMRYFVLAPLQRKGTQKVSIYGLRPVLSMSILMRFEASYDPSSFIITAKRFFHDNVIISSHLSNNDWYSGNIFRNIAKYKYQIYFQGERWSFIVYKIQNRFEEVASNQCSVYCRKTKQFSARAIFHRHYHPPTNNYSQISLCDGFYWI